MDDKKFMNELGTHNYMPVFDDRCNEIIKKLCDIDSKIKIHSRPVGRGGIFNVYDSFGKFIGTADFSQNYNTVTWWPVNLTTIKAKNTNKEYNERASTCR